MPTVKSLRDLFNSHVDFVKRVGDFEYVEAEGPKFATHRLEATSWNTTDKYLRNSKRGIVITQKGYALSVVAEPLKVRFHQTTLKVKRRFPDPKDADSPAYNMKGGLTGKRLVLGVLVMLMGAPKKLKREVRKMNEKDCDLLYRNLIRASRIKFH